jgi:excisionase family DNA binding protein
MTVMPTGDLSLEDPLLSTAKVAEMFDVKPETIRDWIAEGKISGVKINRSWRVRRSVALAFGTARYGDPDTDAQPSTPDDAPEAGSEPLDAATDAPPPIDAPDSADAVPVDA